MSLIATLVAKQLGAGGPLTLDLAGAANSSADDGNLVTMGLGTTTTSVVPITFADLAHFQECDLNDAFADNAGQQFAVALQGGLVFVHSDRYTASKFLRLDADFAAGKYLWCVIFATGTPTGSDPVSAVSQSYLIL